MIRVVLDTNVLFSAILKSTGASAKLLDLVVAEGTIVPCVSPSVLAEYHEVLFRPILAQHAARVEYLLSLLTAFAVFVVPTASVTVATDPDDNCFLECAEAADADFLITGNKRHFPKGWRKMRIVNSREFLDALEAR
ncbi:MAG: putative toxin-antitoxin system toxin component, PIN family [Bryobacteraceae bacterium]|jgi:putative PIN family toxin of toxin-antitoxin system